MNVFDCVKDGVCMASNMETFRFENTLLNRLTSGFCHSHFKDSKEHWLLIINQGNQICSKLVSVESCQIGLKFGWKSNYHKCLGVNSKNILQSYPPSMNIMTFCSFITIPCNSVLMNSIRISWMSLSPRAVKIFTSAYFIISFFKVFQIHKT